MIWILTPHAPSDRWIGLQADRIDQAGSGNINVLATVPEENGQYCKFFTGCWFYEPRQWTSRGLFSNHWLKLDFLFRKSMEMGAQERDILAFMDGDAFPIGEDFEDRVLSILDSRKFLFIKDPAEDKPSCMFFACRLEDWRGRSWCPGAFDVVRPTGKLFRQEFDIGGALTYLVDNPSSYHLVKTGLKGEALHEDFYMTWGDDDGPLVYHHGAGFRPDKVSRAERSRGMNAKKAHMENKYASQAIFRRLIKGENLW